MNIAIRAHDLFLLRTYTRKVVNDKSALCLQECVHVSNGTRNVKYVSRESRRNKRQKERRNRDLRDQASPLVMIVRHGIAFVFTFTFLQVLTVL